MEGEKRGAAAGGENGCGGVAIDGGENLAGVVQLSATGLGFQIGKHRSEEEMMANSVGHISRVEDIPHGAAMAGSKGSSSAQLAKALETTNQGNEGTRRGREARGSSPSGNLQTEEARR
jgi:hypothetical protein